MSFQHGSTGLREHEPVSRRMAFSAPLRAATVVIVAVAVVALVLIIGPRGSLAPGASTSPSPSEAATPVSTPTAAPTAAPTIAPTATPAPTPVPVSAWSGLHWSDAVIPFPNDTSPHETGQRLADVRISDILPWVDGFVAAGRIEFSVFGCGLLPEGCVEEAPHWAFFTSTDGQHWSIAQEITPGSVDDAAWFDVRLVSFNGKLIALDERHVWSSADGRTWTEIAGQAWSNLWVPAGAPGSRVGRILAVAAGPAGLVAIGEDIDTRLAIVARSPNGATWTLVDLPADDKAIVRDVVAYPGGFVIAGRDGQPDTMSTPTACCSMPVIVPGIGRPAAWISSDGTTWRPASVPGTAVAGGELDQVLVASNGLFAIGIATPTPVAMTERYEFTAWTSSDGTNWEVGGKLGSDLPARPALASDGTNMVLLGPSGSNPDRLAGWVSVDGVAWSPLAFTGAPDVTALEWFPEINRMLVREEIAWVVPGGVIVNGRSYYGHPDDDTFWFGTATEG